MQHKKLSELINIEINKNEKVGLWTRFKIQIRLINNSIFLPRKTSLFLTLFLFVEVTIVCFLITKLLYQSGLFPNQIFSLEDQVDLLVVASIFGSFVSGLILFVVGLSSDNTVGLTEKVKVSLKATKIFPILVFFVTYLFAYIFFKGIDVAEWKYKLGGTLILLGSISFISITYALYQAIKSKLDEDTFARNSQEIAVTLMLNNFKDNLENELKRLVGINLFVNALKTHTEYNIEYLPHIPPRSDKSIRILSSHEGTISDIDLGELDKLFYNIQRYLLPKNISIKKETIKKADKNQVHSQDIKAQEGKDLPVAKCNLSITFNYSFIIKKGDPLIFIELNNRLVDNEKFMSRFGNDLNTVITTTPEEIFINKTNTVSSLKDNYIAAIETKALYSMDRLNKLYFTIIEEFWKFLAEHNLNYDSESSKLESGAFPFDTTWSDIKQVSNDIKDIIEIGFASKSFSVINKMLDLNNHLFYKTVSKAEPLLFKYIIFNFLLVYRKLIEGKFQESKIRSIVEHEIVAPLYETSSYYISSSIKKEKSRKQFDIYQSFSFEIIRLYQFLFKEAYEQGRIEDFKYLLEQFDELFKDLFDEHDAYQLERIEREMKLNILDNTDQQDLQSELKNRRDYAQFYKENRDIMLFGFASWLLSNPNEKNIPYLKWIFSYLPSNLKVLSYVFTKCIEDNFKHDWDWATWNLPRSYKSIGFTEISLEKEFSTLFVIRALQVLSQSNSPEVIEPSRILADRIESGEIQKAIEAIQSNSVLHYLTTAEIGKTTQLLELLDTSKQIEEAKEQKRIITMQVTKAKVKSFFNEIVKLVNNSNDSVTKFFKHFSKYSLQLDTKAGIKKKYGYNQILDREVFIESPHVHYTDLEENFAEGIIGFENKFAVNSILEKTNNASYTKFTEYLNNNSDLILLSTTPSLWIYSRKYTGISAPVEYKNEQGITSRFTYKVGSKIHTIYLLPSSMALQDYLIAFPKRLLPTFIQLDPRDTGQQNLVDKFFMQLTFMSHNLKAANKIVDETPPWLTRFTTRADKLNYLKTKVVFKLYERLKLNFPEDFNGMKLKLIKPKT